MMSLIWILACPLGMFAMGGVAWGLGRLPDKRAERLARATGRASCMPVGAARRQPTKDAEEAPQATSESKVPTHV